MKAAYFGTEFKLELPLVITETMHFFFTVYSVNALHGDKQERLVSLDDTITNTVGGASGINLGTSNFLPLCLQQAPFTVHLGNQNLL